MWSSIVWWWSRTCSGRETGLSRRDLPGASTQRLALQGWRCGFCASAWAGGPCACVSDRKRATWRDSGTVVAAWALSELAACSMASGGLASMRLGM
eukprot:scaffold12272_cov65-Phaeocystis_antarctica.AAC.3